MTRAHFPKKNADGSFCVEIRLSAANDHRIDLDSRIKRWIAVSWMQNRSTWKREWRTGPNQALVEEQILQYENEFIGPPEIVSYDGSELRFRLFGKPSAKYWKDWLVSRLIPDLKAQFPEIVDRFLIEDCKA
jgi:hypothetical protein